MVQFQMIKGDIKNPCRWNIKTTSCGPCKPSNVLERKSAISKTTSMSEGDDHMWLVIYSDIFLFMHEWTSSFGVPLLQLTLPSHSVCKGWSLPLASSLCVQPSFKDIKVSTLKVSNQNVLNMIILLHPNFQSWARQSVSHHSLVISCRPGPMSTGNWRRERT